MRCAAKSRKRKVSKEKGEITVWPPLCCCFVESYNGEEMVKCAQTNSEISFVHKCTHVGKYYCLGNFCCACLHTRAHARTERGRQATKLWRSFNLFVFVSQKFRTHIHGMYRCFTGKAKAREEITRVNCLQQFLCRSPSAPVE